MEGFRNVRRGLTTNSPIVGVEAASVSGRTTDRAAAVTASLPLSNAGPLTSGPAILADGALG